MNSPAAIIACPVCGEFSRTLIYRGIFDYITDEKFDLVLCDRCGLGMTDPIPDDSAIGKFYSASYRGDRHAFTDRLRVALRSRAAAKCFPKNFKGRMLDIGCGDGAFAIHQKKLGWDVSVTEIHEPTLEKLRAIGITASTPRSVQTDIHGPFDLITCWHVLEHAFRPDELAKWIQSLLSPRGVFQVSVPNLASWQARFSGRHWLHLDVPRHRYHFDRATLEQLLSHAGFEVESVSTIVLEYDWFGAIQSILNGVCSRPNVLFEKLTARNSVPKNRSFFDQAISFALAAPMASITLMPTVVAGLFASGATLDITARLRAGK